MFFFVPPARSPAVGLRWRASYWFTTFVVGLGIMTDLLVYSIIIPVIPFQLQKLGYHHVSALSGWLLFAYSGGLALSTVPIAILSERYEARRAPLLFGLVLLLGSQVMLMEAPNYAVMCVSRALQGVGSSMVWVVGLALLCDATPEEFVGRQLGAAMSGLSIGILIGPPVGGALYTRFGFRGPFVFCLIVTFFDLVGRLLVVERKDVVRWGVDPTAIMSTPHPVASSAASGADGERHAEHCTAESAVTLDRMKTKMTSEKVSETDEKDPTECTAPPPPPGIEAEDAPDSGAQPSTESLELPRTCKRTHETPLSVVLKLAKSSRALTAIVITFIYGVVYSSQEPSLPLHLQHVWSLDSGRVGLVFLAAVVPALVSSPLMGYLTDRIGTQWIAPAALLLSVPWWGIITIEGPLALFIVALAIEHFFVSGVISPVTAELASVARDMEGVGYAHVYGAFNLAYGIGSSVGPIIGGQIYDHLRRGWLALCFLAMGLIVACAVAAFFYIGPQPLGTRCRRPLPPRPSR